MPINPCGRVCDFLRSAYRTKLKPFRNDPREVDIRWYRCQPDAPVIERHRFFSRNWLKDKDTVLDVGEVAGAPRDYDRGNPPLGATGAHRCGTDDQWENGILWPPETIQQYDVEGLPLCCDAGNPPDIEDDVRDINFWRQIEGAGLNVFYTGGSVTGENAAPVSAQPDTIHALPLFASRGGVLAKLAIWLQTNGGSGAQVKAAIYEAASETDLRPLTLIGQTGDFAADVGSPNWLTANIGVTLDRLKLYWLCVLANLVGVPPVLGGLSSVFCYNVLGFDQSTFRPYFGFKKPFAYGPWPNPFPALTQSDLANGDFATAAVSYIF